MTRNMPIYTRSPLLRGEWACSMYWAYMHLQLLYTVVYINLLEISRSGIMCHFNSKKIAIKKLNASKGNCELPKFSEF